MTTSQRRRLADDVTVGGLLDAFSCQTTAKEHARVDCLQPVATLTKSVEESAPVEADLAVDARVLCYADAAHVHHSTLNPEEAKTWREARVCNRVERMTQLQE